MPQDGIERREVFYSGDVQGVGFRYTTRSLAGRFAVSGFVRNLPDGRVELVAEGAAGEVRRFLDAIRKTMRAYIRRAVEKEGPATGEFDGFEIRFYR